MAAARELSRVELSYLHQLRNALMAQKVAEAITLPGSIVHNARALLTAFEPEQVRIASKRKASANEPDGTD